VYRASKYDTVGHIPVPSECCRHVTSSSDAPDTHRQSRVLHTACAFDVAVNFRSFE